jgi:hypothetical protein
MDQAKKTNGVQLTNCFVVCPIGSAGTEVRNRSDDLFNSLICHVCEQEGIKAERAIENARPGDITRQVVQSVLDADLVIADLTGLNPNVFYELAHRHLVAKPFIHLTDDPGRIPFDIAPLNAIHIDRTSFRSMRIAEQALRNQIKSIKAGEVSFITASAERYQALLANVKQDPSLEIKALVEELAAVQRRCAEAEARVVDKDRAVEEAQRARILASETADYLEEALVSVIGQMERVKDSLFTPDDVKETIDIILESANDLIKIAAATPGRKFLVRDGKSAYGRFAARRNALSP